MSEEQNESVELPDRADYDSPWKKTLEVYFKEFIRFFFPDIATDVNWSRRYIFLDKELQQVVRKAALGRKYVDKLVRLYITEQTVTRSGYLCILRCRASVI